MRSLLVAAATALVGGPILGCTGSSSPTTDARTAATAATIVRVDSLRATASTAPAQSASWTPAKRAATDAIDRRAPQLEATSRQVFDLAETALTETKSSALLATLAESNGFKVERGVSEMPTAWVAHWSNGSGKPVIGVLAEFDALPSLSQKGGAPTKVPIAEGRPGHGCGHNLFGVAATAAAIALKDAMSAHQISGTITLYGTPAEEQGIGKIFMVRDGLFDGVDACLSWHPAAKNEIHLQPTKACISFETTFYGRSAHASAAPWDGVSALDALEAFEHGVNLLREHMPETARIHYVVTEGGKAPNVIPNRARIWMYVRGKDWTEAEKVYAHVERCITGGDLMAWGEEYQVAAAGYRAPEIVRLSALYDYNINFAGSEVMQKNLELVGPAAYSDDEQHFARDLQGAFGVAADGFLTQIEPFSRTRVPEPGGSTDVGNVSWTTPTVELRVATWPAKIPAHSWASTAASGSSGGYRAMLTAAKVLAITGVDFLTEPAALTAMQSEFAESRKSFHYSPAVRPADHPSLPSHMQPHDD